MPASIVKAICAIMTDLEAVPKNQRNQHGGYNYSSTDDIYAALVKKMGKVGLICIGLEDSAEVVMRESKDSRQVAWLKAVYSFILATEEETWIHPNAKRTVMVQIAGPQSFQGAQSFTEKSFLRSLFKLPTGDLDLDVLPENFEYTPMFAKPPVPPSAEETGQETNPTLTEETFTNWIEEELILASDPQTLESNWNDICEVMEGMSLADNYYDLANELHGKHVARVAKHVASTEETQKKK